MGDLPERIVCVDDDQIMRTLMRESIERAGFEGALATCMSGQELLSRFGELQPDLLLLELQMPGMDGLEMLQTLQDNPDFEGVRVIMVTAITKLVMTPEYKKLGVIGIIHKPFDEDKLFEIVQGMWGADNVEDAA